MTEVDDNHRKEFFRIIELPNEELLKEFETTVRNGSGIGYVRLVWMRKEIQKRMNLGK